MAIGLTHLEICGEAIATRKVSLQGVQAES
jgi:hypothetical protein